MPDRPTPGELAPSGTVDPTSTLYNGTMYLMAGLLVVALAANWLVRPVDARYYLKEEGGSRLKSGFQRPRRAVRTALGVA